MPKSEMLVVNGLNAMWDVEPSANDVTSAEARRRFVKMRIPSFSTEERQLELQRTEIVCRRGVLLAGKRGSKPA